MKISILCTSGIGHPVWPWLHHWRKARLAHDIELWDDESRLRGGDLLFLISCGQIIPKSVRERYGKTLVIHASDLPSGRGWSPHVWQVLEGASFLTVTLLEAADKVDSGDIWRQVVVPIPGHFLWDEINEALFAAEYELMDWAVANVSSVQPVPQVGEPSYYRKRTPEDSELNVHKTLAEQFNLLRVSDPERYPAFFRAEGHRYSVTIRKMD